ncbi:endo-1,4-beta-xylanase 1-like [Nymphaea colorata]|nr:endo-1,4-beta-xylanase 1-like [Nymphaea colorata]
MGLIHSTKTQRGAPVSLGFYLYRMTNNNIILNHDFSGGLQFWRPNCCHGYVISKAPGCAEGVVSESGTSYAVASNRTQPWQGLEQDITSRISPHSSYTFFASVRVRGCHESRVQATLRLEQVGSSPTFAYIGSTIASNKRWVNLEGKFSLTSVPTRVIVYLEGPDPGVDLLVDQVYVCHSSGPTRGEFEEEVKAVTDDEAENIILNPRFEDGLNTWSGKGCKIVLHRSMGDGKVLPMTGKVFASATDRKQNWNGIQQDITGRVQSKLAYEVTAIVRIFGNSPSADVRATLWVQNTNQQEQYIGIANVQATDKDWTQLRGKFLLNEAASRVIVYLEGPSEGTDILVNSLVVKRAMKPSPSLPPVIEIQGEACFRCNLISGGQPGCF